MKKVGCVHGKPDGNYLVEVRMYSSVGSQNWDSTYIDTMNLTCVDGNFLYELNHVPYTYVDREKKTVSFSMQEHFPEAYESDGSYNEEKDRKARKSCNYWLVSEYNKNPSLQLRNDSLFYNYNEQYRNWHYRNSAKGKRIN